MDKQDFFYQIVSPVHYDDQSPYKLMTKKLYDIDIDYFQGSVPLEEAVNKELTMDIKHRILGDFVAYGRELLDDRSQEIEKVIIGNVESLVCQYQDKAVAICDLDGAFGQIHSFVRKQLCFVPIPMYDNAELRELYAAAQRVTILERVTGGNDRDVIKYYHALIEHCVWACRMLLRRRAGQFLMQMVDMLAHEFEVHSRWTT